MAPKMVYDEWYGWLTYAQRAAYRKHNVPPALHDELRAAFGDDPRAIVAFVKERAAAGGINYGDVERYAREAESFAAALRGTRASRGTAPAPPPQVTTGAPTPTPDTPPAGSAPQNASQRVAQAAAAVAVALASYADALEAAGEIPPAARAGASAEHYRRAADHWRTRSELIG